jgi:NAD(P)-dependent dehydrogenase (short-subunit alcohol dehydrogenase family)
VSEATQNSAQTVLITGCSSGIGRDAARALRGRGWRVLATCRKAEDCAALVAEGLESFPLDLADEGGIAVAAAETLERTGGRIDGLVNNGAFACPGAVEDLPRAALREIFETNLFGQVDLINRLLPAMRAAGRGRVVMVSSVLGYVAAPWRGAYVATKFALEGISDTLRLELDGSGIAVVLVEPGPIGTALRRNAVPHFERHIDWQGSPHRAAYEATLLRRLYAEDPARDRFELPPSAVSAVIVRALEDPRPAARYRVTVPARGAAVLRRVLPTRLLDRVLRGR